MSPTTIKQHDNGVYYVHWTDGRRSRRQSLGTKDLGEAEKRRAEWVLFAGAAVADLERAYTMSELWSVYWKRHVEPNVIGRATMRSSWANLLPHFGALTPRQINQRAIDDYVAKRASGRLGRKAASGTVRRELIALTAALNFCCLPEHQQCLFDAALAPKFRLPPASEPRERWLSMDELQKLHAAAAELRRGDRLSRLERFLWLALETGARHGAIVDLTWDRVDFETNVIHYDVPGRRKTKKRRASVPMSKALRVVMERAFSERVGALVLDGKSPLWPSLQTAAARAGLSQNPSVRKPGKAHARTGVSPHVLRHTAATHMARRGVPLWLVAKVLGNTLAMVERVYAKHSPDHLREAVEKISAGELHLAD